jgi:chaperone modulatory protein CbpM
MSVEGETLNGLLVDERTEVSLGEVCRACSVHAEWVVTLVEEGILDPAGREPTHWRFTRAQVRSVRTVQRLQSDLGLNLAGAALALDLMDEIEALRARLAALDREI